MVREKGIWSREEGKGKIRWAFPELVTASPENRIGHSLQKLNESLPWRARTWYDGSSLYPVSHLLKFTPRNTCSLNLQSVFPSPLGHFCKALPYATPSLGKKSVVYYFYKEKSCSIFEKKTYFKISYYLMLINKTMIGLLIYLFNK